MTWQALYCPDFRAVSIVGAGALAGSTNCRLVEADPGLGVTTVFGLLDAGRYALSWAAGSVATMSLGAGAAGNRSAGGVCRLVHTSAFGVAGDFIRIPASTAGQSLGVGWSSTGLLRYTTNNGGAFTNTTFQFVVGVVYCIDVRADYGVTTNDHALKISVDGVEIVSLTGLGSAIVTNTGLVNFGTVLTSGTNTFAMSDFGTYSSSIAATEYGTAGSNFRVYGLEPISSGTHLISGASVFKNAAGTTLIAGETASWDFVNDAPGAVPGVTDFVQQTTADGVGGTAYFEWNLRPCPGFSAPLAANVAAGMHPVAAATANNVAFLMRSPAGGLTVTAVDTSVAADTIEYRRHQYNNLQPDGSTAWTLAAAQALTVRFGFSTDTAPPPAMDAVMAFVLVPGDRSMPLPRNDRKMQLASSDFDRWSVSGWL